MANIFPNIFPYNEDSPQMEKLGIQTEYAVYQKIKDIYDDSVDILYGKDFLTRNAFSSFPFPTQIILRFKYLQHSFTKSLTLVVFPVAIT